MFNRLTRYIWRRVRWLGAHETAVASSEYATLLAVMAIGVLVAAMMFGRGLSDRTSALSSSVAQAVNGDDAGGGESDGGSGSGKSSSKGGKGGKDGKGGKGGKDGKGNGGKGNGRGGGKGRG